MVVANPHGGTTAVYFDPSGPAVSTTLSGTLAVVAITGSGDPVTEETGNWQRVLIAGSQTAASLAVRPFADATARADGIANTADAAQGTGGVLIYQLIKSFLFNGTTWDRARSGAGSSFGAQRVVHAGDIGTSVSITDGVVDYVTRVRNLVDGTLTTITGVDRVRNLVDGTLSTITGVDRVRSLVDGTISTVTGVDRVRNVVDGTISTLGTMDYVTRVRNLVDGTLSTVTGVDRVRNVVDGTISTVSRVDRVMHLIDGTVTTVAALTSITNSVAVHILSTNGTMAVNVGTIAGSAAVYFSPSKPIVQADINATGRIFTVSGTTSTAGNNSLVSPSASYNFKVFAYALQTTGLVSIAPRFTTGASAGATELWRPLVNAVQTTSTPIGANLAVSPPGYIFATGTNVTLNLYLDTGTLIHYSVSYIKESA
jgi:hypothetical protein